MKREGENAVVILENVCCAVALMHIAINHERFADAFGLLQSTDSNTHIIEHTEARPMRIFGMVAATCRVAGNASGQRRFPGKIGAHTGKSRAHGDSRRHLEADGPRGFIIYRLMKDRIHIGRVVRKRDHLKISRFRPTDRIGWRDEANLLQATPRLAIFAHGEAMPVRHSLGVISVMIENRQH